MELQMGKNRIFIQDGEQLLAEVTFPNVYPTTVNINHTYVDSSLRGQGIADQLLSATQKQIRANGWTVIPSCSYAVAWFEKHPEYRDLLFNK